MGRIPQSGYCNPTGATLFPVCHVFNHVRARPVGIIPLLLVVALSAAVDDYSSIRKKQDLVESDSLKAGSRVEMTVAELNAYAAHELPAGVRNPKLVISAPGVATGSALVDFGNYSARRAASPAGSCRNCSMASAP